MYNIIAAIFDVESEGYQAISTLSKTPIIEETSILQMALVKRENGSLKVCDSYDSGIHTTDDMLLGGLLGGLWAYCCWAPTARWPAAWWTRPMPLTVPP